MKDTARFTKRGLTFVPGNAEARELVGKVPEGKSVFLSLWMPRNMAQHRKYFAILNNVVEATDDWASTEDLRFDIFKALKRGTFRVSHADGHTDFHPDSMAFASMPRDEFERLYDDTIKLLTNWLGADPEMLVQEAA